MRISLFKEFSKCFFKHCQPFACELSKVGLKRLVSEVYINIAMTLLVTIEIVISFIFYIPTYFCTYILVPLTLYPRKGSRDILDIPPRYPHFTKMTMSNTAAVTGGKPIAVYSQSISVSAVNPLVAFYDIRGRKGVLSCSVPDTTRDLLI
jgi:hypothetical protein